MWLLQLAIIGVVEVSVLLLLSFSLEKLQVVAPPHFNPRSAKPRQWLTFLLLIFVFGLTYDLVVGNLLGVFFYPCAASLGTITYATFIFLNSTISYGVFACTVAILPFKLELAPSHCRLTLKIIFGIFTLVSLVAFIIFSPALKVFSVGATIVFASEFALLSFARLGPVAALLKGDLRLFFTLWGFSVSIGILYESANSIIRLWEWSFLPSSPHTVETILVILIGYFVLVVPAFAISRWALDNI